MVMAAKVAAIKWNVPVSSHQTRTDDRIEIAPGWQQCEGAKCPEEAATKRLEITPGLRPIAPFKCHGFRSFLRFERDS